MLTRSVHQVRPVRAIAHVPRHVAVIMDGNGRWAQNRGLPRLAGHEAGVQNLRRVVERFARFGVKYLTVYAFSTENWQRPRLEVRGLLRLLRRTIDDQMTQLKEQGARVRHLGRTDRLPKGVRLKIDELQEQTKDNTRITVNVALDYGGRDELVEAVKRIVAQGVTPEQVTPDLITRNLFTSDMPDPDLIIRTGGEMRLSNFLLWQSAYSELYITPVLWPDFDETEVERALLAYSQRQRRFGRT